MTTTCGHCGIHRLTQEENNTLREALVGLHETVTAYFDVLEDGRKPLAERQFSSVALPNLEKRVRAALAKETP